MKFISTLDENFEVDSFKEALLSGLAPNKGLLIPKEIPKFSQEKLAKMKTMNFVEISYEIARQFIAESEIPNDDLKKICEEVYSFSPIIIDLENYSVLELFHGPTLAFKDFAACFMARCIGYFIQNENEKRTVLVATSGDTGGAIGRSFLGIKNINVVILYPLNGVSELQRKQLTTLGGNVQAVEVDGSFDDCQKIAKEAFSDYEFSRENLLISANSINIGRIIPQTFYYVWSSLRNEKPSIFSIPSGNIGNATGAMFAKMMGFSIEKIITVNNANNSFYNYLQKGEMIPAKWIRTISNAMDICVPNNYHRIKYFFRGKISGVQNFFIGYWFNDEETKREIKKTWLEQKYLMCPHTAIGALGMDKFIEENDKDYIEKYKLYTVSTAHPAKFVETIESTIGEKISVPEPLESLKELKERFSKIDKTLNSFKLFLSKK
jgi:threonine synthase